MGTRGHHGPGRAAGRFTTHRFTKIDTIQLAHPHRSVRHLYSRSVASVTGRSWVIRVGGAVPIAPALPD